MTRDIKLVPVLDIHSRLDKNKCAIENISIQTEGKADTDTERSQRQKEERQENSML